MKIRIDQYLVDNKYFDTREQAKRALMSGVVYVDGIIVDKAGSKINVDANVKIKEYKEKYVSRGGYKLEKAIEKFSINLNDKCCVDIGSSTGGFTDCMLQNKAKKVYAIDVGYGQLALKLRNDKRVAVYEKTNAKNIDFSIFNSQIDFLSIDVSFISAISILKTLNSPVFSRLEGICLVKPQFEAGRDKIKKGGVVKDKNTHIEVLQKTISDFENNGFYPIRLDFSPIKGPKGNIEFLLYFTKIKNMSMIFSEFVIESVVNQAHIILNNKK